jgi:uncharacterized repeat protein (TIGR03943 family)
MISWFYHNLFMRLWLVFAGLIGISTTSVCPCCGQAAASCPTGFSLIAGLAGILALLGVFQKKTRAFLRRVFPFLTETQSHCAFWGFILFLVATFMFTGYQLAGKPLVQKEWSPGQRKIFKKTSVSVLPAPIVTPPPAAEEKENKLTKQEVPPLALKQDSALSRPEKPVRVNSFKENSTLMAETAPALPVSATQTSASIAPASPVKVEEPLQETEPPTRMRAIINPDGSVEFQKNPEGLIRYETWNFMELNDDIYERINAYRGKKVEIEGYVYRRSDFEPGYFVTARLYMWCCTFDAAPVGPLCKWNRADELKDGAWIRVEGTIEPMFFHDTFEDASDDIPLIKVEKVERIPKLENPYVYLRGTRPTPRPGHS